VLHADDDIALGPQLLHGAEAAFAAPVEIKMLEKCSHWIQMDYPMQVNALCRDWLERQDRGAGKQA
jgi:pimeloyl-ACP methyl ester carboxylesterase